MDIYSSNPSPVVLQANPSFFSSKKNILITSILSLILIITGALVYFKFTTSENKPIVPNPAKSSATPETKRPNMQLSVEGEVLEVKPEYIMAKENNGQLTQMFTDTASFAAIQTLSLLKNYKPAADTEVIAGEILSNKQVSLTQVKKGDNIKALVKEKDKKLWLESITVMKTEGNK